MNESSEDNVMKHIIGNRVKRIDGYEKVTGKALFGDDLKFPGMLHAACRHTDIPVGKITKLDIEQAKKTEIALRNEEMKIEDLYKKLVNHPRSRKKPRKINTKKVKEKLTKLVQAYDAKTISRSVYEKLKARYEKELKNSRS